jgi:hypothetical protein
LYLLNPNSEHMHDDKRKCLGNKSISVTFASVLNASKHVNDGKNINLMNYCEIGPKNSPEMYGYSCGGETESLQSMVVDTLAADKGVDNLQQHCSSKVSRNPKKKIMYEEKIFDEDGVKQKAFKTSMLTPDFDDRSPENIRKVNLRKKCEMLQLADMDGPVMFYGSDDEVVSRKKCINWTK